MSDFTYNLNPSGNQMLVLQIIHKVKEASTLKEVCSQAFAQFVCKVSAFLAVINERPIFVDLTFIKNLASDFKLNESYRTEFSFLHIMRIVRNLKR